MKRKLTFEENIFFAKKRLTDCIYACVKMENIDVTFPQMKTVVDGHSAFSAVSASDIKKISNLHNAWLYMLETVQQPLTVEYAGRVSSYLANNENALTADYTDAVTFFLKAYREGGKCAGLICANKLLIQSGSGLLIITQKQIPAFNTVMEEFCKTNDYDRAMIFFSDKILTIEF